MPLRIVGWHLDDNVAVCGCGTSARVVVVTDDISYEDRCLGCVPAGTPDSVAEVLEKAVLTHSQP